MTKSDIFLSMVIERVRRYLKDKNCSEMEKKAIAIQICHIFEKNYDLQTIFEEAMEFIEENETICSLTSEIENYYLTKLKHHD